MMALFTWMYKKLHLPVIEYKVKGDKTGAADEAENGNNVVSVRGISYYSIYAMIILTNHGTEIFSSNLNPNTVHNYL